MTAKRYLDDPYRRDIAAEVTASADGWCALSQTVFYPGGGGQPCDRGQWLVGADALPVSGVREGSIGAALYRGAIPDAVPAGVPPEAAEAARATLGGALAVAAREAFTQGLQLTAAVSAVMVTVTAVVATLLLRRARPRCN